ncbi:2-oxoacid:acceptor oxidoreductase family protein [bacterium]|nr:2-oxoacid:acceptor oxidoreductase family protein [bacterium]
MASQIVGYAAVNAGLKVFIGETFGLSQRGGPVMSHVRITDNDMLGPLIPNGKADFILGIEPLETLRVMKEFGNRNSIVITNSRPIYPINVTAGENLYPRQENIRKLLEQQCQKLHWLDLTKSALNLGSSILLNVILLGTLSKLEEFPLNKVTLFEALKNVMPPAKLAINQQALEVGFNCV